MSFTYFAVVDSKDSVQMILCLHEVSPTVRFIELKGQKKYVRPFLRKNQDYTELLNTFKLEMVPIDVDTLKELLEQVENRDWLHYKIKKESKER